MSSVERNNAVGQRESLPRESRSLLLRRLGRLRNRRSATKGTSGSTDPERRVGASGKRARFLVLLGAIATSFGKAFKIRTCYRGNEEANQAEVYGEVTSEISEVQKAIPKPDLGAEIKMASPMVMTAPILVYEKPMNPQTLFGLAINALSIAVGLEASLPVITPARNVVSVVTKDVQKKSEIDDEVDSLIEPRLCEEKQLTSSPLRLSTMAISPYFELRHGVSRRRDVDRRRLLL